MKYVYVLCSSENDFYYEQFLISITSLRLHNPDAFIVVLVDSVTKRTLAGKRCGYERTISEVIIIEAPETFSQKEVSRWIKTSIKNHVTGDFLYLDCDTVIAENLDAGFPPEVNIGAVLDTHLPLEKHHLAPYFKGQDKRIGFVSAIKTGKRYNGGIIFCRDGKTSDDFFLQWNKLWLYGVKKGSHQDMPPLNQADYEMGGIITELDGKWNCQITHNGLPFLSSAKMIHCFASSMWLFSCPFLPASIPFLTSVKETGIISEQLMGLLKNPKAAFDRELRVIAGALELDVINSKLFSLLVFFRKKAPLIFKKINNFLLKLRSKTQT